MIKVESNKQNKTTTATTTIKRKLQQQKINKKTLEKSK